MAGRWRVARIIGQVQLDTGDVRVRTSEGMSGPYVVVTLDECDISLITANPDVLGRLGMAFTRGQHALAVRQIGRVPLDPHDSVA